MDSYDVIVIGGGGAGIASVVALIESDVKNFLWIDPKFEVGCLHQYQNIPANTFIKLLNKMFSKSEKFNKAKYLAPYDNLDINKSHSLKHTYDSLKLLSDDLREQCKWKLGFANKISKSSGNLHYEIEIENSDKSKSVVSSKNIILSVGGKIRSLGDLAPHLRYTNPLTISELDMVETMDEIKSKELYEDGDEIAVIGSSHSAILAVMNAVNSGKKIQVHIFMRSLIKIAYWLDDRVYFNTGTGLKGVVANWCRDNILNGKLENIHQHYIGGGDEEILYKAHLPKCNKIVYAVGFDSNYGAEFFFDGKLQIPTSFDQKTNQIIFENNEMKGIFGLGIGFPEDFHDINGNVEPYVSIPRMIVILAPKIVRFIVNK